MSGSDSAGTSAGSGLRPRDGLHSQDAADPPDSASESSSAREPSRADESSWASESSWRSVPDRRLLPLAASAWAGAWLGTGESVPMLAWLLVAVVVLGSCLWAYYQSRWLAAAVAALTVAVALCGLIRVHSANTNQLAQWAADGAHATLTGQLSSDVVIDPPRGVMSGRARATVSTQSVSAREAIWPGQVSVAVTASGQFATELAQLPLGSSVQLEGLLQPRRPGDQSAASFNVRAPPQLIAQPSWWQRAGNRIRAGLRHAMRWSPAAQAQLLPSFVVGDTAHVPQSVTDQFKATSLTHLMAVSGTNLALTMAFMIAVAQRIGLSRRSVRAVAVFTVVAFIIVCRGEPSVLRAAAMGVVTLSAVGSTMPGRRSARHLAVAIIALLLWDPWLGRSMGFALSVAATGGIIWWGSRWQESLQRWLPGWLAEAIAIPVAAQLATQPLITSISGSVSVVGILANALVAPFVGPATVLGLCAALLELIPGLLGACAGFVAGWCVQPILWVASWLAATPAATWPWPATPVSLMLLVLGCAVLGMLLTRTLHRPKYIIPMLVIMLLAPWWQPRPLGWPGPWRVLFCDVGQGDATLIRAGPKAAVMIDVGPAGPMARDCVKSSGVSELPMVMLTHFHADHSGGLEDLLASVRVGLLVLNPVQSPVADVARVLRLAREHGVAVATGQMGAHYQVGEASVQVIGGGTSVVNGVAPTAEDSPAENNSSLISHVSSGGVTALITGDAETEEQQVLSAARLTEPVQVWKMPHHGAARQDPTLWEQSGAALAVASVGLHNSYGHPTPTALRLAARFGMRVARTDEQGSIAIALVAGQLEVRSQRARPP